MLTQHQIILYLLQHKLIDPASIVAGDLTVVDVSRRNCNFKVISTRSPCYLIKQGISPDRVASVAHEAAMYQLLQSNTQAHKVRLLHYLPHFYGYDPQARVLILELLGDAEDFRQYHTRHSHFSTALASMMGKALRSLHCLTQLAGSSQDGSWFSCQPPWVFTIHRPQPRIFWDVSEAKLQLIRLVQHSPDFCQLLDDLRREWRADKLIHYDIKWDNWIIFAQSFSRRKVKLKLVDWELARLGDPCWDVGSVFSSYLSFWLSSIPITGEDPPDRFLELSNYPLERMQPALRSFWASYVQQMDLDASIADQWLLRSVRYAAARLVQTAFEQMQRSSQLTGNIICILQLSLNMLRRPHEAAVLLLGIPLQQRRVG
jgi:hypothetical protein